LASPDEALELAQRALAAVVKAGGSDALARVTAERSQLLRFARSRPTQATAVDDLTVELAAVRDGHVGSARTNREDPEALAAAARAAVDAAEAAARHGGDDAAYPGFPAPAPARAHEGWNARTARLDPGPGGAALATAFEVAERHGVEAHGVWTSAEVVSAVATSAGAAGSERVTDAFMKVTCIAPDGRSGFATQTGVSIADIDAGAAAESAARKAAAGGGAEPATLPPGDYPVVLEAEAVGELLGWVGVLAFNGLAYAEGRSAIEGKLGSRVAAPSINLSDSPRHPRTLPRSFDAEGVPKAPLPLIQDGVAHRIVHDTRSAALLGGGAQSTGHAAQPGGDPYGAVPTNLVLIGGGAPDADELARPIERGIYVTRLWYTNPVRPQETLITGMTRDGTFLIEDGQITRPLRDMRLTDSALGLLERVQDLGSKPRLVSEGEFYGRRFAYGTVCPPLRASHMRFTG
jgi:predicted Zn-dependent protease